MHDIPEARKLLSRMAQGDSGAWQEFLDHYGDLVYSCVYYTLRKVKGRVSAEDARDATQDLFVSLLTDQGRKLLTYEGRNNCSLASWLRTVAVRHALATLRASRPSFVSTDDVPEETLTGEVAEGGAAHLASARETLEEKEQVAALARLVEQLPERQQLVFSLYYLDGRSHDEIAQFLSTTANNVDQMLHRIRRHLRQLKENEEAV